MENSEIDSKAREALNFAMEAQRLIITGAIDILMLTTENVMKDMADVANTGNLEELAEGADIAIPLLEAEMNGISLAELTDIKDEQFKNRLINAIIGHTNKAFEIGAAYGRLKLLEEAREAKAAKKD